MTQDTSKTRRSQETRADPSTILRGYMIEQTPAIGSEVETFVLHPDGRLIDVPTHDRIKAVMSKAGLHPTAEPLASIFELKTAPHKNTGGVIADMASQQSRLQTVMEVTGFVSRRQGYLNDHSFREAYDAARPNQAVDYFLNRGEEICARAPLMTTSAQISISYADPDHAYRMARLLMVATPALTALCENSGNRLDGRPCAFNPGATVRLSQPDGRGGLSPVIKAAAGAEDMMIRQTMHICHTPMMLHFNKRGTLQTVDILGRQPTFSELGSQGLNTVANAALSENAQFHMLKLTTLPDGTGKRLELRMADNGPFQHDVMCLVAGAVAFRDDARRDLADIFTRAGLDPFHYTTGARAEAALGAVAREREAACRLPYGESTVGKIADALIDIAIAYNDIGDTERESIIGARRKLYTRMKPA